MRPTLDDSEAVALLFAFSFDFGGNLLATAAYETGFRRLFAESCD